jgi:hypothetical protein
MQAFATPPDADGILEKSKIFLAAYGMHYGSAIGRGSGVCVFAHGGGEALWIDDG